MICFMERRKNTLPYRILCGFMSFTFLFSLVVPPQYSYAQIVPTTILNLPAPGAMIPVSNGFTPALIKGITIHPENPLRFNFIVEKGDSNFDDDQLRTESTRLIKYFLASLTVPENELWVNLSPYEKDRIIPREFGLTEMGRDMLAQDYILKQLTASMMYPEDNLGREFWDRVYTKAQALYGTTEIPMNTFNKIWIVPEKAVVYQHETSAFVVGSHLKVMLEEDYVALQKNLGREQFGTNTIAESDAEVISGVTSEIVREVLVPEIEKEVNEGKNFAQLRQIYHSLILASWYKKNLKDSLLGQVYMDKNKVRGVDVKDKEIKQKIYNQYIEAFKKGVYDYIKEEYDPSTQMVIPRKYFSGGLGLDRTIGLLETETDSGELDREQLDALPSYLAIDVDVELADIGPQVQEEGIEQLASVRPQGESLFAISSDSASVDEERVQYFKQKLGLSEVDVAYLSAFYKKFREGREELRIGETFFPSALLTQDERRNKLGVIDFRSIKGNREYLLSARGVTLRLNPMNGGLGSSFIRSTTLKRLTKRDKLGAKSHDSFFENVLINGERGKVVPSVADLKYRHYLYLAENGVYRGIILQELVNPESKTPMLNFFDSEYILDRADESRSEKRTYRQVISETSGIELDENMIEQAVYPNVNVRTGELIDHSDAVAPGGHGFLGTLALQTIADNQPQGKVVRAIFNGDGVNNFVPPEVVGWMVGKGIPIVMLTTTKTVLDRKGGLIGLEKQAQGKFTAQILELAQAKRADQEEYFQNMGLTRGETGAQLFNTNTSAYNETVLYPFLKELKEIIGDEKFFEITSPDLISNPKEKNVGRKKMEVFQLEGSKGSSLLNLNKYVVMRPDRNHADQIKALLKKFGLDRLVYFVNFDPTERTEFFTPEKFAWDHELYDRSDMFTVDIEKGLLLRSVAEGEDPSHLPGFELDDYYKDVEHMIEAFGNFSAKGLKHISIKGKVHFPNAVLRGNIEIVNETDEILDLYKFGAVFKKTEEGHLIIENRRIHYRANKSFEVETITDSAQLDRDDLAFKIVSKVEKAAKLKAGVRTSQDVVSTMPISIFLGDKSIGNVSISTLGRKIEGIVIAVLSGERQIYADVSVNSQRQVVIIPKSNDATMVDLRQFDISPEELERVQRAFKIGGHDGARYLLSSYTDAIEKELLKAENRLSKNPTLQDQQRVARNVMRVSNRAFRGKENWLHFVTDKLLVHPEDLQGDLEYARNRLSVRPNLFTDYIHVMREGGGTTSDHDHEGLVGVVVPLTEGLFEQRFIVVGSPIPYADLVVGQEINLKVGKVNKLKPGQAYFVDASVVHRIFGTGQFLEIFIPIEPKEIVTFEALKEVQPGQVVPFRIGKLKLPKAIDSATTKGRGRSDSASLDVEPLAGDEHPPIYFFGQYKSEIDDRLPKGNTSLKMVLGGKGSNLAGMAEADNTALQQWLQDNKNDADFLEKLGITKDEIESGMYQLSVPIGFTVTTEQTKKYEESGELSDEQKLRIWQAVLWQAESMGKIVGAKLGEGIPHLVSVRSGAAKSMPGMMDTILNLGMNDDVVLSLAEATNEKAAWSSYSRFIEMYSETVLGVETEEDGSVINLKKVLQDVLTREDATDRRELSVENHQELVRRYKEVLTLLGLEIPSDPLEQIYGATIAVMRSGQNKRALRLRKEEGISDEYGRTGVNIQAMVFGNLNEKSLTGVAHSRDTATGVNIFNTDWAPDTQGESVVDGSLASEEIFNFEQMLERFPYEAKLLRLIGVFLEGTKKDVQDMEFTSEYDESTGRSKLWMLQTRNARRTVFASIKTAVDMVEEGLITKEQALWRANEQGDPDLRVNPKDLSGLLVNNFDPKDLEVALAPEAERLLSSSGLPASPGQVSGVIALTKESAVALAAEGKAVILVRLETSPEDIDGMLVAKGFYTVKGGLASHAAIVARGKNKTAIVGDSNLEVDQAEGTATITKADGSKIVLKEGEDYLSMDALLVKGKMQNRIIKGEIKTVPSTIVLAQNVERLPTVREAEEQFQQWGRSLVPNFDTYLEKVRAEKLRERKLSVGKKEEKKLSDEKLREWKLTEDKLRREGEEFIRWRVGNRDVLGIKFILALEYARNVVKFEEFITKNENTQLSEEQETTYRYYKQFFQWVNEIGKEKQALTVLANTDDALGMSEAVAFGAEGIGLARTEHMFSGDGREMLFLQMLLARETTVRDTSLETLQMLQRADFEGIMYFAYHQSEALPITIRLLDPPLDEFLPKLDEDEKIAEVAQNLGWTPDEVKKEIINLGQQNQNPMFALRGARLTVKYPDILKMQVNAMLDAVSSVQKTDRSVKLKIMVPLINDEKEMEWFKVRIEEMIAQRDDISREDVLIGTMIETPAAAINAGKIAEHAEFMSFGTNDLTQAAIGVSREEALEYLHIAQVAGIYEANPFETVVSGVEPSMVRTIESGRETNAQCNFGGCGEQMVDVDSINASNSRMGLHSISGGPPRLPAARLAATQSALSGRELLEIKESAEYKPTLLRRKIIKPFDRRRDLNTQFRWAVDYVNKVRNRKDATEEKIKEAKRDSLANLDLSRPLSLSVGIDDNAKRVIAWAEELKTNGVSIILGAQSQYYNTDRDVGLITTDEYFTGDKDLLLIRNRIQEYLLMVKADDRNSDQEQQVLAQIRDKISRSFNNHFKPVAQRQGEITVRLPNIALEETFQYPGESQKEAVKRLARRLGIPAGEVRTRIAKYDEKNPAIGTRGSRLFFDKEFDTTGPLVTAVAQGVVQGAQKSGFEGISITFPFVPNAREVEVIRQGFKDEKEGIEIESLHENLRALSGDGYVRFSSMIETPYAKENAAGIAQAVDSVIVHPLRLTEKNRAAFAEDARNGFLDEYIREGIWPNDIYDYAPADTLQSVYEAVGDIREKDLKKKVSMIVDKSEDIQLIKLAHEVGVDEYIVDEDQYSFTVLAAAQAAVTTPSDSAMADNIVDFDRKLDDIIDEHAGRDISEIAMTAKALMDFSDDYNYLDLTNTSEEFRKSFNQILVRKSEFARDIAVQWLARTDKNSQAYKDFTEQILVDGFTAIDSYAQSSVGSGKLTQKSADDAIALTRRLLPEWLSERNNIPDFIKAGLIRGLLEGRSEDLLFAFGKGWRMFGTAGIRNSAFESSFPFITDLELREFSGQVDGIQGSQAPVLTGPNFMNIMNFLQQERAIVNAYREIQTTIDQGEEAVYALLEAKKLDPRFVQDVRNNKVSIAYDSRLNGKFYAHMLAAAFLKDGVRVDLFDRPAGVPAVVYQASEDPDDRSAIAILISASHSEANYNGFKAFLSVQRSQVDKAGKNIIVGQRSKIVGDESQEVIPYVMQSELGASSLEDFYQIFKEHATGEVALRWFGKEEFDPEGNQVGAEFDSKFYDRYYAHVQELSPVELLDLSDAEREKVVEAQRSLNAFYTAFSGVGAVNAQDFPGFLRHAGYGEVIVNDRQTLEHDGKFTGFYRSEGTFEMPDPGVTNGWIVNFVELIQQFAGESFELAGVKSAVEVMNSFDMGLATDPDIDRAGISLRLGQGIRGGNIKEKLIDAVMLKMDQKKVDPGSAREVIELMEQELDDQLLLTANDAWSFIVFHKLRLMHERGKLDRNKLYIIEKSHVTTDALSSIAEYFRENYGYNIYTVDTYVGFTELAKKSRDLFNIARMAWFIRQHLSRISQDAPDYNTRGETLKNLLQKFKDLNEELKSNVMFQRRGVPLIDETIEKLEDSLTKGKASNVMELLSTIAHMEIPMGVEESNGYGEFGVFVPNEDLIVGAVNSEWEAEEVGKIEKEHISEKDGSLAAYEFAELLALGKALEGKNAFQMYLDVFKAIGAVGTDNRFIQYRGLTGDEKKLGAVRWFEQTFGVLLKRASDNLEEVTLFDGKYTVKEVQTFRDAKYDSFWIGFPEEGVRLTLEDRDGSTLFVTFRPSGTGANNRAYSWVFGAKTFRGKNVADMNYEELNEYRIAVVQTLDELAMDFFGEQGRITGYVDVRKEDFQGLMSALGEVTPDKYGEILAKMVDDLQLVSGLSDQENQMREAAEKFADGVTKYVDNNTGRMKESNEDLESLQRENRAAWGEFIVSEDVVGYSQNHRVSVTINNEEFVNIPEAYAYGWQTSLVDYIIGGFDQLTGQEVNVYVSDLEIRQLVEKRLPENIGVRVTFTDSAMAEQDIEMGVLRTLRNFMNMDQPTRVRVEVFQALGIENIFELMERQDVTLEQLGLDSLNTTELAMMIERDVLEDNPFDPDMEFNIDITIGRVFRLTKAIARRMSDSAQSDEIESAEVARIWRELDELEWMKSDHTWAATREAAQIAKEALIQMAMGELQVFTDVEVSKELKQSYDRREKARLRREKKSEEIKIESTIKSVSDELHRRGLLEKNGTMDLMVRRVILVSIEGEGLNDRSKVAFKDPREAFKRKYTDSAGIDEEALAEARLATNIPYLVRGINPLQFETALIVATKATNNNGPIPLAASLAIAKRVKTRPGDVDVVVLREVLERLDDPRALIEESGITKLNKQVLDMLSEAVNSVELAILQRTDSAMSEEVIDGTFVPEFNAPFTLNVGDVRAQMILAFLAKQLGNSVVRSIRVIERNDDSVPMFYENTGILQISYGYYEDPQRFRSRTFGFSRISVGADNAMSDRIKEEDLDTSQMEDEVIMELLRDDKEELAEQRDFPTFTFSIDGQPLDGEEEEGDFAMADETEVRKIVHNQILPEDHIDTFSQVLYAASEQEAEVMLDELYQMGITDSLMPYIVVLDENGKPMGSDAKKVAWVNTNFRTDRRGPWERSVLAKDYDRFQRPKEGLKTAVIAPTSALEGKDLAYPTTLESKSVPLPLSEVLYKDGVPVYLYAVGEKIAHVIKEFLRGGRQTLFSNERAQTEKTPKPTKRNVEDDRFLALSQNMQPLLEYLIANLKNPPGSTITLNNGKTISGEIIDEDADSITVKSLSNFEVHSKKASEEAISLEGYLKLPKDKRLSYSIIRIPNKEIKSILHDRDNSRVQHIINFGLTDLVGHAGNLEWSIETLEITDMFVGMLFKALDETGTYATFTGDHGNIEVIVNSLGRRDKKHSTKQVGLAVRAPKMGDQPAQLLSLETPQDSSLTQIYPTMLQFHGIEVPEGKDQRSVLADKEQEFVPNAQGRKQMVLSIFDGLGIPDADDDLSPYNRANLPNIKSLFSLTEGGGRVNLLNAHGEFVGTRKAVGPTNIEIAQKIRKLKPKEIHLQVEGEEGVVQKFNNIFTTDSESAVAYLEKNKSDPIGALHYEAYEKGSFQIVSATYEEVATMLEIAPFYKDKRFSVDGYYKGRLLLTFDEGQIGGSEQGHQAIGTGSEGDDLAKAIKRIDDAIETGDFFKKDGINKDVIKEIGRLKRLGYQFRVQGFLQETGVHSSVLHMKAWIKLLKLYDVPSDRVLIRAIVDGRDSDDYLGHYFISDLHEYLTEELGEDGKAYGRIRLYSSRNNFERDVNLLSRIKIDHYVELTGQLPSEEVLHHDEREYAFDEFNEDRARQLIASLSEARFEIDVEQKIRFINMLIKKLETLIDLKEKFFGREENTPFPIGPFNRKHVQEAVTMLQEAGFPIGEQVIRILTTEREVSQKLNDRKQLKRFLKDLPGRVESIDPSKLKSVLSFFKTEISAVMVAKRRKQLNDVAVKSAKRAIVKKLEGNSLEEVLNSWHAAAPDVIFISDYVEMVIPPAMRMANTAFWYVKEEALKLKTPEGEPLVTEEELKMIKFDIVTANYYEYENVDGKDTNKMRIDTLSAMVNQVIELVEKKIRISLGVADPAQTEEYLAGRGDAAMVEIDTVDQVEETMRALERSRTRLYSQEEASHREGFQKRIKDVITQERAQQLDQTNMIADAMEMVKALTQPSWKDGPKAVGVALPKKYGGTELGAVEEAMLTELIARESQSMALIYDVWNALTGFPLKYAGTEEQKEKYLKPLLDAEIFLGFGLTEPFSGSDSDGSMRTTAVKDGDHYVLNGTKHFITVGTEAKYALTFAITNPEADHPSNRITVFIVPLDPSDPLSKGVTVNHMKTMLGHRGTGTAEIVMDNVRLPASNILGGEKWLNKGSNVRKRTLESGRISISSIILGSLEATLEETMTAYKGKLEQDILNESEKDQWKGTITKLMIDTLASRLLLLDAARAKDAFEKDPQDPKKIYNFQAALAKLKPSEDSRRNVVAAMALIGPESLKKGHKLERTIRDDRLLQIGEGTTQMMRLVVEGELKRRFRNDTGETQGTLEEMVQHALKDLPKNLSMHVEDMLSDYNLFDELYKNGRLDKEVSDYYRGRIRRRLIDIVAEGQALKLMQLAAEKDDLLKSLLSVASYRVENIFKQYSQETDNFVQNVSRLATATTEKISKSEAETTWQELDGTMNIRRFIKEGVQEFLEEERKQKTSATQVQSDEEANVLRVKFIEKFAGQLKVLGASLQEEFKEIGFNEDVRNIILEVAAEEDLALALMILEQEKGLAVLNKFWKVDEAQEAELALEEERESVFKSGAMEPLFSAQQSISVALQDPQSINVTASSTFRENIYKISGEAGYVLNSKSVLGNEFIVFARTGGSLSAFYVPEEGADIFRESVSLLGLNKTAVSEVSIEGVGLLLGEEGQGREILGYVRKLEQNALKSIARGAGRKLVELGKQYAAERQQFGKPIGEFPEMRELLEESEELIDRMSEDNVNVGELLEKVATRILQVYGGYGYDKDFPIAQMWTAAQTLNVFEAYRQRTQDTYVAADAAMGDAAFEELNANIIKLTQARVEDRSAFEQIEDGIDLILSVFDRSVQELENLRLKRLRDPLLGGYDHGILLKIEEDALETTPNVDGRRLIRDGSLQSRIDRGEGFDAIRINEGDNGLKKRALQAKMLEEQSEAKDEVLKGNIDQMMIHLSNLKEAFLAYRAENIKIGYSLGMIDLDRHLGYIGDMSVRAWNVLSNAGIRTFRELMGYTEEELSKIKGMGRGTLNEIIELLRGMGLSLKDGFYFEPIYELPFEALVEKALNTNNIFLVGELRQISVDKLLAIEGIEEGDIAIIRNVLTKRGLRLRGDKDKAPDDSAMAEVPGGIDFNPALLDMQILRDGRGVPLPLIQQPIHNMNIEGFLPVIINMTPVVNLPLLLGFNVDEEDTQDVGYEVQPQPMDKRARFKAREPEQLSWLN